MQNPQELAKPFSDHDLRVFGINQIAYIKPQEQDGQIYYAIHAADGTEVARAAAYDIAVLTVRQNEMEPVSLH